MMVFGLPLVAILVTLMPATVSADGVLSWKRVPQSLTRATLTDVLFTDTRTGYACADDSIIIRTTDGGKKWAQVFRGTTGWQRLAAEGRNVIAAGLGTVTLSDDGGATFHESRVPVKVSLNGAAVDSAGGAWVCGMSGAVFYSSDRGANWESRGPARPDPLFCIAVTPSGSVVSGGLRGLWLRDPAGKWAPAFGSSTMRFRDVVRGSGEGAWLLGRKRNLVTLWSCSDVMGGCREFASLDSDDADLARMAVGAGETIWLAGHGPALGRTGGGTRVIRQEDLPGFRGDTRGICVAPDGAVWVSGGKGQLFRGEAAKPPESK